MSCKICTPTAVAPGVEGAGGGHDNIKSNRRPCSPDNAAFLDENGAACSEWVDWDCTDAVDSGMSVSGQAALLEHCATSCGFCENGADATLLDTNGDDAAVQRVMEPKVGKRIKKVVPTRKPSGRKRVKTSVKAKAKSSPPTQKPCNDDGAHPSFYIFLACYPCLEATRNAKCMMIRDLELI